MSRLKPMFFVLLALIVCGASSQATVCELSCGLDARGMACHMSAAAQETSMQAMPHGHCGASMLMDSDAGGQTAVSSLHGTACGHVSSPAVEYKATAKAHIGLSAMMPRADRPDADTLPRVMAFSERRPPPLIAASSSPLTTLRV